MLRKFGGRGATVLGVFTLAAALATAGTAAASHPQPSPDVSKLDYTPIGKFGPAGQNVLASGQSASPAVPPTNSPLTPTSGRRYNPSGRYVAYDTDIFESLTLPFRAAGDTSASDPLGNGGNQPDYGKCDPTAPPDPNGFAPLTAVAGRCPNHQLEYLDYFEETMKDILGPFGVTVKRYPFDSPGSTNTRSGQSYNIAAVVPGADHPEQTVIVGAHYDQTTEAPASGWDSAEGHSELIRMAKIMADYWRATGTRPATTIKFVPWDQEESGLLGSIDYVQNNVPPGEEDSIRGYFNVDPCGGAYPAFYRGNPNDRVPLVLQLVNPDDHTDDPDFKQQVERFNTRALTVVDDVMNRDDDKLATVPGSPEIFVSDQEAGPGKPSQRPEIETALGGLLLFTSDYSNFEGIGVPFFNLGPAFFGPSADGTPNRQDGIAILHTPNDHAKTINALTSADQTGVTVSEGWAKGMEFCAQVESWYMLQPQMAGGQTANSDVVAYYEALPNEAIKGQRVKFDASGSYEYTNVGARSLTGDLTYKWDFGDGSTGTGQQVDHAYSQVGRYASKLTVTSKSDPSKSDTMEIPVTVVGSSFAPPVLKRPPAEDADGTFPLSWTFDGDKQGFDRFSVEESRDFRVMLSDDAEGSPTDRFTVTPAQDSKVEPWQASDSSTAKFRGNQRRSGERSFWTGVSPANAVPSPTSQTSTLTLKDPVKVPGEGETELSFWSLFQSEGDDQGRVEVAIDDGTPGGKLDWKPVDVTQATNTAVGGSDRDICSPADPGTLTTGFENRKASLGAYRGRTIRVRFVYRLGPDDRSASQPCGWYIDDIRVDSGVFKPIGTTTQNAFTVSGRSSGLYAYRVVGRYKDGITTEPSNVESVRVTGGRQITGTNGNDVIVGTPGRDVIRCGDGDDVVYGGGGDDVIRCGKGNDRVYGGGGNDRLYGESGNDRLNGGSGRDRLYGGSGRDRLYGASGRDRLNGGSGSDRLAGGSDRDFLVGASGNDRLAGQSGSDLLVGSSGNDLIFGGSGNDRLSGGRGRDRLFGGSGRDRLRGGSGRDRLNGGPGRDRKFP